MNSVDFISSRLFGFTSGSIGFSLAGPAAGLVVGPVAAAAAAVVTESAAGSVPCAATVTLSLLFFLCSPLRTSSSQCLVDYFIPSIQSFCSMPGVPEACFESQSAAI